MKKEDYKIDCFSKNLESANKEKLKSVFPECFSEGTLDIDKLLSLCGEYIDNDFEKYKFEWKGKSECLRIAQQQSRGTLRPCPEESVNFSDTENLYVEGDNLEVLKLLQTSYYNRVKMIYIDPPYNTGNDFIYKDKFGDSIAHYKDITSQTTKSNPESMGKYHTNWLNMMYPRLKLANSLLKEDGVIFISIDDHEVHNLRKLCDEVFGEENFVAQFSWRRSDNQPNIGNVAKVKEYIICYCKSKSDLHFNKLPLSDKAKNEYRYEDATGKFRRSILLDKTRGRYFYNVKTKSGNILNGAWMVKEDIFRDLENRNCIYWASSGQEQPYGKIYLHESKGQIPNDFLGIEFGTNQRASLEVEAIFNKRLFDFPKPVSLISTLVTIGSNSDDIILDFFSGSATTAHAVMQLNKEDGGNRKFIMVQLPELTDEKSEAYKAGYKNICEIGKERIRRAGKQLVEDMEAPTTLDIGFKVLKLDTSNITEWDNSPILETDKQLIINIIEERMDKVLEGIKSDRSKLDVVFEIMMKLGVPFHIPLTQTDINGKQMYVVGDFLLLICLESEITFEDVKAMCNEAPAMLVCSENGFADSCVMANVYYYLQEVEIELKLI